MILIHEHKHEHEHCIVDWEFVFHLIGDLKRICETDLGLISQCCLTKYVLKVSRQYLANVSLKINVKVCVM